MSELKPCPFCGASDPRLGSIGNYQFVFCAGCGCKTANLRPGEEAGRWNTRADIPWLTDELVERVREMLDVYEYPAEASAEWLLARDILAALEPKENRNG